MSHHEEKNPEVRFVNKVGGLKILTTDLILNKVLNTFIDNTIKHGGDKAKTITLSCEEKNDELFLIYEDDGIGISLDKKEKIFQHNFGDGKGLGLFLVKELFNVVQVSIIENGECGKGVRFEMIIPKGNYTLQ